MQGMVTLNFCIRGLNDSFVVPFIVTKQELGFRVVDFNTIECLVRNTQILKYSTLSKNSVFPDLNSAKTEPFVNLIQDNSNVSDFLGEVKTSENLTIPPNSMKYIKCKFKTESLGTKTLSVIFQPELNLYMDLVIAENLVRVNPSKPKPLKSRFTT